MIWIIISFVALATLWYFLVKPLSYWKNKGVKQSNSWPVIGDSWRLMLGKNCFMDYCNWMYNTGKGLRYHGLYDFTSPVLCVTDPELIKQITVKEFDSFSYHVQGHIDAEIDPYWGNNLLVLRGQKWKRFRTILSPIYTGSKLRVSYNMMVETAENVINYFLRKDQDIIEVEMKDAFSRYSNDVIATTAFGVKVDSFEDPNNSFYYHGRRLTNFSGLRALIKILFMQFAPITWKIFGVTLMHRDQMNYFHSVLFNTIKQREEQNIIRPDLVNILMEAKKERENNERNGNGKRSESMTDEEMLAQVLIFFFAGFETISNTLSWGAYELAVNKDVQDKLRQEIKETYEKHGKPTFEVLQEMKYLDMVVSEIIRKWPNFLHTDRGVAKPFTIEPVNKNEVPVQLEPGTQIFLPIFAMQRDPQYFPDPEKFDPERFSDENKHNINPYTYLTFGIGPRFCIGNRFALMEIKCMLFNILLNFEIIPTKRTKNPPEIVSLTFQYSMKGDNWLGLKRDKLT